MSFGRADLVRLPGRGFVEPSLFSLCRQCQLCQAWCLLEAAPCRCSFLRHARMFMQWPSPVLQVSQVVEGGGGGVCRRGGSMWAGRSLDMQLSRPGRPPRWGQAGSWVRSAAEQPRSSVYAPRAAAVGRFPLKEGVTTDKETQCPRSRGHLALDGVWIPPDST